MRPTTVVFWLYLGTEYLLRLRGNRNPVRIIRDLIKGALTASVFSSLKSDDIADRQYHSFDLLYYGRLLLFRQALLCFVELYTSQHVHLRSLRSYQSDLPPHFDIAHLPLSNMVLVGSRVRLMSTTKAIRPGYAQVA